MSDDYVYPKAFLLLFDLKLSGLEVHCIASRITAENPDDSFKPTSGKWLGDACRLQKALNLLLCLTF